MIENSRDFGFFMQQFHFFTVALSILNLNRLLLDFISSD